jgi:hypothetical protein
VHSATRPEIYSPTGAMELVEEQAHAGGLSHSVGHSAVLGPCVGAGHNFLSLGDPRDEVGTQEHDIAEVDQRVSGQPAQSVSV